MKEQFNLFVRYLHNERIKEYENIIIEAKRNGYQIISLALYAKGMYEKDRKILILRHDVDHVSGGTVRMFEIEKKYKAYSSFYFRDSKFDVSTTDKKLMQQIENYGSEASLHFETIANYGMERGIPSGKVFFQSGDYLIACQNLLREELSAFREKYNVPCLTIASHGSEYNAKIEISNNVLTENVDSYKKLGIILEAYNKRFISDLGIYISDVPIEINGGYRYGVSVVDAIKKGITPILFLSHPNHWHYSFWKQFKKLVKVVVCKPEHNIQKFRRIAQ